MQNFGSVFWYIVPHFEVQLLNPLEFWLQCILVVGPLKFTSFSFFSKSTFSEKKYTRFFPKTKFTLVDQKWTIKVHKNQLIFLKMVGPFLYTNLSCVQLWTQLVQNSGSFSSPIGEENDPFFYTSWVQICTLAISSVYSSTLAGSRVLHQLSHRSTLLHLLGPKL